MSSASRKLAASGVSLSTRSPSRRRAVNSRVEAIEHGDERDFGLCHRRHPRRQLQLHDRQNSIITGKCGLPAASTSIDFSSGVAFECSGAGTLGSGDRHRKLCHCCDGKASTVKLFPNLAHLTAVRFRVHHQVLVLYRPMSTSVLEPADMEWVEKGILGITWNDGHKSVYPVRFLQQQCPCAACTDEWTGELTLATR